ncbi:MAG: 30S ribosomal protein S12 methylthiotransferase RimO [Thermoflexaceae bacterium]|nr:30S ribosomal protein S12 methylthiotransferase RimO [Thermoflexaceae bacterium]
MKLMFISLGCDKNLVDTEVMMGLLSKKNITFTDDEKEAEIIIINTCCFINDAKEESVNTILEMAELKKKGSCKVLIVSGCMAQRYRQEIIDEIPEVDAILGTASYDKIVEVLDGVLAGQEHNVFEDLSRLPDNTGKRMVTTGGHYAYLKIAEGCDKCCTYCIIPKIRGRYRSYPMEELISQAEELVEGGVKELLLVAQETTLYGKDLYGEKSLHRLIKELCKIDGLRWIRILYCYPEEIYDELIEVMKNEPKVCHYLDMPIQHANDDVLRRMGRRTNQAELREIIGKLRKEIPDIALRTSLIAGFPGETKEAHEEMLDFVDEIEFDRLGVFAYSAEEDTPAFSFANQIDDEVKEEWRDEIMELQQEVSTDKSHERIGKTYMTMIEGKVADENAYVGRTYMDAPNVDGYIFVNTDEELMTGDFVPVKVTGALEYDLIGEIDYESAK